jgi:hypothetical protein
MPPEPLLPALRTALRGRILEPGGPGNLTFNQVATIMQ